MTLPAAILDARAELDAVIAEIREVPGFESFLQPPTFDDVAEAAQQHPLVYISPADPGGLALIVRGSAIEHVELPDLTADRIEHWTQRFLDAHDARKDDLSGWITALDEVTAWLWGAVMAPVLAAAPAAEEIVVVACGLLGLLPLHAAWTHDETAVTGRRYALDVAAIRYVPNARALIAARNLARDVGDDTALVVVAPQPVQAPELPWADVEGYAVDVALGAGSAFLSEYQATEDAFRLEAPYAEILHLACHGIARLDAPLESGLLLADDKWLTIRDLLSMRLHARLAVLSACETSRPGTELPDEVVSLPTGLLQAGVASVLASLWVVPDFEAALLMARFYGMQNRSAIGLRDAQQWMRDTTDAQKLAELERTPSWLPPDAAETFAAALREPDPSKPSGMHPWAGFVFVGA